MTVVFIKKRERWSQTYTHRGNAMWRQTQREDRDGHMMTEAEMVVVRLHAKKRQGPQHPQKLGD